MLFRTIKYSPAIMRTGKTLIQKCGFIPRGIINMAGSNLAGEVDFHKEA